MLTAGRACSFPRCGRSADINCLNITVLGCNDFYSYRKQIEARGLPLTPEVLLSLPPFSSITFNSEVANGTTTGEKCKPEVAKTGLGSSAAMTTSVVAAVLHYLGAVNLSCPGQSSGDNATGQDLDLVHAIAQSAHCIAQGKIGSGFDVSAAVYGSQRYVRFSPEILSSAQATGGTSLPDVVSDIVTQRWDHENKQFSLPPLMTLLLGEPGTGGSSTPSMVGSVKRWQKSDPEKSKDTWSKLAIANSALENQLRILKGLSENHREAYESVVRSCSHLTYGKVATNQDQELIVRSLLAARDASLEIRLHMREMGIAAGVPQMLGAQLAFCHFLFEKTAMVFLWKMLTQEQGRCQQLYRPFRLIDSTVNSSIYVSMVYHYLFSRSFRSTKLCRMLGGRALASGVKKQRGYNCGMKKRPESKGFSIILIFEVVDSGSGHCPAGWNVA
ncbi:unnamed protein product [Miscanthus lutarioriparius]|uniref:phosphomevalonate kinase n=1 Tax=Miscanthus lutarioriparius TaxID=422564 RepID=A0A811MDD6_9POAL|nr:unnamed protein product [Miscanthus lutarioriparius]